VARISALPDIAPAGRGDRALDAHDREERPFGDLAELTVREREVLALLAQGLSDRGIAKRIWLTRNTVETHIRHILGKLKLPNDAHQNRRVLAALIYLRERDEWPTSGLTLVRGGD
jgi:DNA-binding NarL/FixJ family response regulator